MSQLNVDSIKNQAGNDQPDIIGTTKAWVNFNGVGTVAIRDSFNVSSITDNGVGLYTVNFTNAMNDTNYSVSGNVGDIGTGISSTVNGNTFAVGSLAVATHDYNTYKDREFVSVQIFGELA